MTTIDIWLEQIYISISEHLGFYGARKFQGATYKATWKEEKDELQLCL
jgi:hypothetical protein